MAAASVSGKEVLASDIDPVAVEVAQVNAQVNGMEGLITCIEASGFEHPDLAAKAPFDLIFANILKAPLLGLAPSIANSTAQGGTAILSGLLVEQGAEVAAAYEAEGFEVSQRRDIGEWTALRMRKLR
jgi:ribosomal protein L11 methyltransferase